MARKQVGPSFDVINAIWQKLDPLQHKGNHPDQFHQGFLAALTYAGPAIAMIAEERNRQVAVEGYSAEHDDTHVDGALVAAAIVYALGREWRYAHGGITLEWPFERASYKPKDPVSNLVRAGALIAAEIERVQRSQVSQARSAGSADLAQEKPTCSEPDPQRAGEFVGRAGDEPAQRVEAPRSFVVDSRPAEGTIRFWLDLTPNEYRWFDAAGADLQKCGDAEAERLGDRIRNLVAAVTRAQKP